jgi:hypothetical protein
MYVSNKQNSKYITLIFLAGVGYYFFICLNNKRKRLNRELLQTSSVSVNDLDKRLRKDKES